jgi:hypothetical protein
LDRRRTEEVETSGRISGGYVGFEPRWRRVVGYPVNTWVRPPVERVVRNPELPPPPQCRRRDGRAGFPVVTAGAARCYRWIFDRLGDTPGMVDESISVGFSLVLTVVGLLIMLYGVYLDSGLALNTLMIAGGVVVVAAIGVLAYDIIKLDEEHGAH